MDPRGVKPKPYCRVFGVICPSLVTSLYVLKDQSFFAFATFETTLIDFVPSLESHEFIWDDEDEIDRELLKIDKCPLGEGAFGVVFKAEAFELSMKTEKQFVAVKMLKGIFYILFLHNGFFYKPFCC